MWVCPVCKRQNEENLLCRSCGFDVSFHYRKYRTLAAVDMGKEAAACLYQADWAHGWSQIFSDPEKLEDFICLVCEARRGVPEARKGLGEFYKSEFSDRNMKERGDFWLQKTAGKAPEPAEGQDRGQNSDISSILLGERDRRKEPCTKDSAAVRQTVLEPPKVSGRVVAVGDNRNGQCNVSDWEEIIQASAGDIYTVGLRRDGSIVVAGDDRHRSRLDIFGWENIAAVSAGTSHIVGLQKDGKVVATGNDGDGQCQVSMWKDIAAISAGMFHTIGLSGGSVVAAGDKTDSKCDVWRWKDITAVSAGRNHTIGLRKDGQVAVAGNNRSGQCNVSGWRDIIAVSAGEYHTVGLRRDGKAVAAGSNKMGQCNVSEWRDIVAVSAGDYHTIGLRKDGTVVAAGSNSWGQCNVSDWRDIVAVSAGARHTAAIQSTGHLSME